MSSDVVDFQARSLEGRGLSMKAQERWVDIQKHTFLNWVNLQLQGSGLNVTDPEADFDDGVRLCALVESLQNRKIGRVIKKPMNHHQNLENVTLALNAIAEDNVRLVNIGSEDIVNGSTKLILGLVWTLILRYQIGKTKIPPKKLMLAWLKAVVPECAISNFTSDWNDGVALHALVDYCQPGLCPNWRQLSRHSRLENCTEAMEMAKEKLNIPIVVRPEDYSSSHLDDLSGMTYLSYFMMVDAPGYMATRREIRALLQEGTIDNFTTDWNDGRLLANLVTSVGGNPPEVTSDSVQTLQNGIDSARQLGIEPIFAAKEIADPEVEHLGVMAYAAYFRKFEPVKRKFNSARMQGEFDDVMVRQEKRFYVTAEDGTDHSVIRAELTGPDSTVPVRIDWSGDTADCSFTPTETGHHKLNVTCEEKHVPGSPVTFKVSSDRSKVHFEPLDKAVVGYNSELIVDTTEAGEGEVRMEAESPSGKVVNFPVMYKNGIHMANFTPSEIGDWQMSMIYEGDHITGSPYTLPVIDPTLVQVTDLGDGKVGQENSFEGSPQEVEVVDTTRVTVTGEGLSLVPVNTPAIFTIHTTGAGGGKVDVDITGPEGENVPFNLSNEPDGDCSVHYTPTAVGNYDISVKYGGQEVSGSPFVAKAYNTGAILVTPIKDGFVNQPMFFTIDVGDAGEGQLQIMVNNGNIRNEVEPQDPGIYRIKFVPVEVGRQEVAIKFNDHDVPNSPLVCMALDLTANVVGLNPLIPIMVESSFSIKSQSPVADVNTDVSITAPNGEKIAARLIQQADGDYKVEWTPNNPGRHSVDVLYGGQQIQGSPFFIDVFDIHKIRVNNFYCGNVGEKAGFRIDCTQAGQGDQEIRVQSATGRIVPHHVEETAHLDYNVSYTPVEVGTHQVFISYSGMELNGSPFHQEIFEGALPSASGDGLYRGEEDKPASFIIDARRMHGEPTVQVDGPQSIAKCNIDHLPDGQYKVTYIPVEVGIFTAQVKWNGKDIPGSPFHPKIVNALKVRVIGGWQHYMDSQERVHLVVGEEKEIPFDTSEAGSGHLRAEVKSPSGFIKVNVDEEHKGKSVVKFVPQEEGVHYINLYWCDHPLVNSPYLGYATSGVADPSKVILTGRGVKEGVVREEAEFIIDGSQAGPGEPDVQLIGVRAEIQVFTTPLGGGKYRCTYIPVIPGAYLLHISWNGRQLRGSPYKVNVIGASYPNRVIVNGEGLKGGLLGQNLDFRIDTRKAGPGELTAYCMGPSKVAYCELSDHHDGTYRLAVRAQEVGNHVLQIKYGGEHVQGSPFHFKVSAQPDASKVRVSGPGVEHGLLANYQSNFIVETKGAGAGQLTVRIRGPKGAFQVEMYRESHKDRTILCRYYPTVTGLYIINVRWSGVDVPGSPFHVNILDTHQELEHVLRDQGYTPNGHQTSFNSNGSGGGMINHHHLHNNNHSSSRVAYHQQQQIHQSSQNHAHNTSRSSGYYAWRGDD